MRSQNHQHAAHYPEGRVDVTGLLYGSVGLVLAFTLDRVGMLKRADAWLFDLLLEPLFHGQLPETPSMPLTILCAAIFCYGLSYAVLDSPGVWRRVLLGVSAAVLTLAMVPTLAVWNVYFSPFLQLVGVFWSWFCVVIYTQHHQMPCDSIAKDIQIASPEPQPAEPTDPTPSKPAVVSKKKKKSPSKKKAPSKKKPSEDKYKPKS